MDTETSRQAFSGSSSRAVLTVSYGKLLTSLDPRLLFVYVRGKESLVRTVCACVKNPVSQRNSSGPRICSGGTDMLAGLFRCRRLYGPPSAWTPGPSTLGCLDPRSNYPRVDGPPRSMYTRVDGLLPGWLDPPLVANFLTSQNICASLLPSHSLARIRG